MKPGIREITEECGTCGAVTTERGRWQIIDRETEKEVYRGSWRDCLETLREHRKNR